MPGFNDQYAYIICQQYGFMPQPDGKYEPHYENHNNQYFTFADRHDKSNIIIQFDPDQLDPVG